MSSLAGQGLYHKQHEDKGVSLQACCLQSASAPSQIHTQLL